MAKEGKGNKKSVITTDERFSGVHNDPRFRLPKRNDFKVEVDERFSKSDLEAIKKKSKIDKYGRKIKNDDDGKAFNKYYKTKDEKPKSKKVESEESESEESSSSDEKSEESDEESEFEVDEAQVKLDLARGEGLPSDYESSSDESSSDEESSEDEFDEDEEETDEKPPEGDPSPRFAVVNLDWDHVKSVDLMATFQSFVPSGGHIENISIYPSEFGKERLQKEDIEGPPRELFKSKKSKKKSKDSDDEDSDSELEAKDLYEEADGEVDYDSKSLRRYQLQRLRYYYAIVTCDSIKTAKNIYDNCDGTEYESTANFFDLRYVPDEMEFDDKPRDSCNKIPSNYKPETFVTDALQHSKVKLTWDETPAERVKLSSKAFSQRELDDMDFKAYLASDNSDEESDHEDLKNKYKNLVGASTRIGNKNIFDKSDKNDDEVDMEITFTPGLDEKSGKSNVGGEGEEQEEESTIDKLKRQAKERRKNRKERIKELKKEAIEKKTKPEQQHQQDKKSKKKSDQSVNDKNKAELELLMLEENNRKKGAEHFNLKELIKSEKEKSKKSKYRNKDQIIEDDFKADLNDPRFNEIFTNHDFAIDPSQPQFKKTATMSKILEERNKRREGSVDKINKKDNSKKRKHDNINDSATQDSGDMNSLVQRIKRKSKAKN